MERIYEEQRANGLYFAENHGAGVAGVFFVGKRCRKPKYIATANANPDSIKRRIEAHANPKPPPPKGVAVNIFDL